VTLWRTLAILFLCALFYISTFTTTKMLTFY
jgi:hypothetical protein